MMSTVQLRSIAIAMGGCLGCGGSVEVATAPPAVTEESDECEGSQPQQADWRFEVANDEGDGGWAPVMALDPQGKAHVVFRERRAGALMYATNADGAWQTHALEGAVSAFDHDLAVDHEGHAHVAFVSRNGVEHRELSSGGALIDSAILAASDGTPRAPRIAVDAHGRAHLAFSTYDDGSFGPPTGGLHHAVEDDGAFVDTLLAAAPGEPDLAAGRDGVHLLHPTAGGLNHWILGADGWHTASPLMLEPDISLRAPRVEIHDGELYVAAAGWDGEQAFVARRAAGAWQIEVLPVDEPILGEVGAAAAADGGIRAAWVTGRGDVLVVRAGGSGADAQTVAQGSAGRAALAAQPDGRLHLAYYDWNRGRLVVARDGFAERPANPCDPAPTAGGEPLGAWTSETIVDAPNWPSPVRFAETSLDIDEDSGVLHVAYAFGNTNCCPSLALASLTTRGWQTETVAEGGSEYGVDPEIAVAPDGGLHLSYVTMHGVVYLRRAGGSWIAEEVDGAIPIGASALVLDRAGSAHLFYSAGQQLRHARRSPVGWQIDVVDAGTEDHLFTDVAAALAAEGSFHLSYVDHYGEVRHATDQSGAWVTTAVADSYGRTSLAVSPSGAPHVSFSTFGGIELAVGSRFSITNVDRDAQLASRSAVAMGPPGIPEVLYEGGPYHGVSWWTSTQRGFLRESVAPRSSNPAAAVDARGVTHVVYFDLERLALRHALRTPP